MWRAGFTLVETIIALVLSSVVLILVSTTFLVQSQYYSGQRLNASVHDNARMATERVASEIRSVMAGGFVVAGARTLTLRSPMMLGMVCDRAINDVYVHLDGGLAALDTDEIAGVALRNMTTGAWTYANTTWLNVNGGTTSAASNCASEGADTAWAPADFRRIVNLNTLFGAAPDPGVALMFFRQTTFKIQQSTLEPVVLGLYRGIYGQSLVEFATGMDSTAMFQYRTGGATYADTITSASLANIDAVRIVADARMPPQSGGQQDITFGWSANVILRNVP